MCQEETEIDEPHVAVVDQEMLANVVQTAMTMAAYLRDRCQLDLKHLSHAETLFKYYEVIYCEAIFVLAAALSSTTSEAVMASHLHDPVIIELLVGTFQMAADVDGMVVNQRLKNNAGLLTKCLTAVERAFNFDVFAQTGPTEDEKLGAKITVDYSVADKFNSFGGL